MADDIKRLHYFNSQFLRAEDFNDEQAYHIEMRRRHNRLMHTFGIADGLEVTFAAGGSSVTVQPGTAIDVDGNEIVLLAERVVELSEASGTFFITIAYHDEESNPTNETGGEGNTRITESPLIQVTATAPSGSAVGRRVILGRIAWSGTQVTGVDVADRRTAGVVGGDLQVRSLALSNDNVVPAQWPRMQLGAAGRADLQAGLNVTGNLNVGGTISGTIAANAVGAAQIAGLAVGTAQLANGSVSNAKLAPDSVTADKIANGAVGNAELAPNAVGVNNIANSNVTSDKIAQNAVTSFGLADNAVTTTKLSPEAVTRSKIKFQVVASGSEVLASGADVLRLIEANVSNTVPNLYFPMILLTNATGGAGSNLDVQASIVYRRTVLTTNASVFLSLKVAGLATTTVSITWQVATFAVN